MYTYDENDNREQVFTCTIRLGNAAMLTSEDVADKLRDLLSAIEAEESGYFKTIFDNNGNEVGQWKVGPVR